MSKRLYAAYGSDTNTRRMIARCPAAKFAGTGMIKNCELLFRGIHGFAYATVEHKNCCDVPVALWELTPECEQALDSYDTHMAAYRKETVKVSVGGSVVDAMIYKASGNYELNLPSLYYYRTICDNYKELGLPRGGLEQAISNIKSTKDTTLYSIGSEHYSGVVKPQPVIKPPQPSVITPVTAAVIPAAVINKNEGVTKMEHQTKHSSGVAKAALATAIPAAAISILDWIRTRHGRGEVINAETVRARNPAVGMETILMALAMFNQNNKSEGGGCGCGHGHGYGYRHGCHEGDRHVNERELKLTREVGEKEAVIAKLESEKYTDNKFEKLEERLTDKIERVAAKSDAAIDFVNEKFTKAYGELAAKYGELRGDLAMECERRACGDKETLTYLDGHFIRADKVLDQRHIHYGAPEVGVAFKSKDFCRCGGDDGFRNGNGGKAGLLADLIAEGSITGTLTLGGATVPLAPAPVA